MLYQRGSDGNSDSQKKNYFSCSPDGHYYDRLFYSFFTIHQQRMGNLWIYFHCLYLLTNLIVAYIPEKYFYDDKIFYGFILSDSILLPAGIYFSGYVGSDLYLMFFFIISLTTMSSRFGYLMINTSSFLSSTAGCYIKRDF
jgi:hypothetical protein